MTAASAARETWTATGTPLPDPVPLIAPGSAAKPYPLHALPSTMRDAVVAYQRLATAGSDDRRLSALDTFTLSHPLATSRLPHLVPDLHQSR